MRNFYYTRVNAVDAQTFEKTEKIDSFNLDFVVKTMEYQPNCCVVILNDGHDHTFENPVFSNTGKLKSPQRVKQWVASEIFLTEEDTARFRNLTEIK